MPVIKLVEEGTEIQIVDVTRPIANRDHHCAWCQREAYTDPDPVFDPVPKIGKGTRVVRVVYKLRGKFESDYICLDCWCGPETNHTATSS